MLIKRPLYNKNLKCVAVELITQKQQADHQEMLAYFTSILKNLEPDLPLFMPFALKDLLAEQTISLNQPIILKLHANDIDHRFSMDEVQKIPFSLALMVSDAKQLSWLNIAEYIALNEAFFSKKDLQHIVKCSKSGNRKLIAYDINQMDCFERCKALIMDYYCGDFLFQPQGNHTHQIAANKLNVIQLINKLQQTDVSFIEITELIQSDPLLSFQLLRLANSAAFSGCQSIESIQQAVMRLGITHLRNWIMLMSLTKVSDKPLEVLESGLIRAHMAQELANAHETLDPQSAYTTGLLSVLDCLLDNPMPNLIEQIVLSAEIKNALLAYEGPMGELLKTVKAYEQGHWNELPETSYHGKDLSEVYISCLEKVSSGKQALAAAQ